MRAYLLPVGGTGNQSGNKVILASAIEDRIVTVTLINTNGGQNSVFVSTQETATNGAPLVLKEPAKFHLDAGDRLWAYVNDTGTVYMLQVVDESVPNAGVLRRIHETLKVISSQLKR